MATVTGMVSDPTNYSSEPKPYRPGEKLCIFCDYFGWNGVDYYDYGGQTGGGIDGGGLSCGKGMLAVIRWGPHDKYYRKPDPTFDILPDDSDDFAAWIQSAGKCKYYAPPK